MADGPRVVLVEDDTGDAVLVQALLEDTGEAWDVEWVTSIAAARRVIDETVSCVLVDLGLPDARELQALEEILRCSSDAAVVVLTGLDDERRGLEALSAGAQDYLVKGAIDARGLARAIRYAVERKQAEETSRRLREATITRRENERLERGLLPKPLVTSEAVEFAMSYRPGGGRLELGGDFYDVVELGDRRIRIVIGDVSGHGPDEAAIGVVLRAAWRGLVLASQDQASAFVHLQRLLESERSSNEIFVTCCDVIIDVENRTLRGCVAGHPLPVIFDGDAPFVPDPETGPALGVMDHSAWPVWDMALPDAWSLMVFTDGLIEGFADGGSRRLGVSGLLPLLSKLRIPSRSSKDFVDGVVATVAEMNGAPLPDDTAVLFVQGRSS